MNWMEEETEKVRIENYQNYRITLELKGKMTPTEKGVIRLLKGRMKNENRTI